MLYVGSTPKSQASCIAVIFRIWFGILAFQYLLHMKETQGTPVAFSTLYGNCLTYMQLQNLLIMLKLMVRQNA